MSLMKQKAHSNPLQRRENGIASWLMMNTLLGHSPTEKCPTNQSSSACIQSCS
jgi:hypothetical protein